MSKKLGFEIDDKVRRYANRLECEAAELVPELLAESCTHSAAGIMTDMDTLIRCLRDCADRISKFNQSQE